MNRIYQGRVTKIDLLEEKQRKGEDLLIRECSNEESDRILWDFHELFQDAVNYYLVCLMALASDPANPITKIRDRVDGDNPVHNVWKPFRRKGQKRQGMRTVATYFGLNPNEASLDECCVAALKGNDSIPELLDLALLELLHYCNGDGKIQQEGRSMLPRFCNPDYLGDYNTGTTANLREYGEGRLSHGLHFINTEEDLKIFVADMKLGWVVNESKRGKIACKEDSRKRLLKSIEHFGQFYGTHKSGTKIGNRVRKFFSENISYKDLFLSIENKINRIPIDDLPLIPPNAKSIPDRLEACLLLKYFPSLELAELVKLSFPFKEKVKYVKSQFEYENDDAIKQARTDRGYIFAAFTSLNCFCGKDAKPAWIEFDIAAFKEALKSLHQIEQKGVERQKEQVKLRKILTYMENGKGNLSDEQQDEGFELPPVLKDDPRVERLEKIRQSLAQASDLAQEEISEYGMGSRTIRGFEDLEKKWNRLKLESLSETDARAALKGKLNELQVEQRNTIGSVALFEKMMDPENWIIWQQAGDRMPDEYLAQRFARNPLEAYVRKLSLIEEIARLGEPIRFTPADARYSRRQYQFGDKNTFKSAKGQYRHEQNRLACVVGIAVREEGTWKKQRACIHYTAPRFLRDGLRSNSENLAKMPWLQPMMEALGENLSFPQDLHNFPVFLMPKRGKNDEIIVNLNFPITLDEASIAGALGKRDRWNRQFAGGRENNIYLRWPEDEWPKGWKENAWYNSPEPFRLVSVDLGVRDAGALALIECRPDPNFGKTPKGVARHCRPIGEANGKQWYAAVCKTKMLRLPGEDAMVFRDGRLQQELSGEKGRLARRWETEEACKIASELGYADLIDQLPCEGKTSSEHRFFAEQNRMLLLALRWAQGRLRGWQSASWRLNKDPERAKDTLRQDKQLPDELSNLVKAEKWPLVESCLEKEIEALKQVLCSSLERIANRVVPLRNRSWEWVKRDDIDGCILRQTERKSENVKTWIAGQRGLSIERIEQIEELRKRCQSLNKAMQHVPGTKPQLGFQTKGQEGADPCPDILDKLEHIREQRVNQTAHLILAEALGVQLKPHSKSKAERKDKDIHGEYEKIREPVDFIVLEDLNRYLTSQGRSRTENSRLMKWCHRAILGKLKQLCETYGIPVLETAAAYSSRFSAKDGSPGFRAKEVTLADREKFPWKKMLENREDDVVNLFKRLEEICVGQSQKKKRKLLAPMAGGPIFISMNGSETQADINAAINLGLRAVAAPGARDIHHKIRTESDGNSGLKPLSRSKREIARWGKAPEFFIFENDAKLERNSNCFPLIGFRADYENCTLDGNAYATGKGLWGTIKKRQWERVCQLNEERIRRNDWEDKIPW